MKHSGKLFLISMVALACTGCAQKPPVVPVAIPVTPLAQTQPVAQNSDSLEWAKTKRYISGKYNFMVDYPESWTFTDETKTGNGLIFSPKDDASDELLGGTNLHIDTEFTGGDLGLGMVEEKSDHIVNWTGKAFGLTYTRPENSKDPMRVITISSDILPGRTTFVYDAVKNPNGEKQALKFIENIIKK